MASILFVGSFLAGSLLSLLIPVGLLIAVATWHVRAIMRVPPDPEQTAAHAAGVAEREGGLGVLPDSGPTSSNP
jgi:hypothetical protein